MCRWLPGKDPLFTLYHDQLLLVGFNHPHFAVLETASEKLNKLSKVTNLIIDVSNSFNNEQRFSFHTQKLGLQVLSISGDENSERMLTVQEPACSMQPDHEHCRHWGFPQLMGILLSEVVQHCWCLSGRIQLLVLLDGLSPSLNLQKLYLKSSMSLLPALRINLKLATWDIQTNKHKNLAWPFD